YGRWFDLPRLLQQERHEFRTGRVWRREVPRDPQRSPWRGRAVPAGRRDRSAGWFSRRQNRSERLYIPGTGAVPVLSDGPDARTARASGKGSAPTALIGDVFAIGNPLLMR